MSLCDLEKCIFKKPSLNLYKFIVTKVNIFLCTKVGKPGEDSEEDPYSKVKEDPYSKVKEDPYSKVKEDPYSKVKEDPYSKVKEDPYSKVKDCNENNQV